VRTVTGSTFHRLHEELFQSLGLLTRGSTGCTLPDGLDCVVGVQCHFRVRVDWFEIEHHLFDCAGERNAYGALAPHHSPTEYADKYKGMFDEGDEAYREWVVARMIEKGIIPERGGPHPHVGRAG